MHLMNNSNQVFYWSLPELLNEAITGDWWPPASERNKRLRESAEIMRALWAGKKVTHYGLVVVEEAKLYTLMPVEEDFPNVRRSAHLPTGLI